MVSQRQRLAKKQFKQANPDLFPAPEPTPPKDPSKKKHKQKSKFKRKKSGPTDPNKPKKPSHSKHPLRVSGMMPGQSCFICTAPDHIAKNCPMKSEWERNKICLSCRKRGHSLKNCPENNEQPMDKRLCYNCGGMGHSLDKCPQPLQDGGTKYANCFICNEIGHLSKDCPKNTHGIYPKGGCCNICGGITHLARDCPNKRGKIYDSAAMVGQSFDGYQRPNKVTKLGGDDLEDDFAENIGDVIKPAASKVDELNKDAAAAAKTKIKHAPKVVNFMS